MIPEKCDRVMDEHWSAYVDDTLTVAESAEAEQHLQTCAECRDVVAAIENVVSQAASVRLSAPQTVIESIRREMRASDHRPSHTASPTRPKIRPSVGVAVTLLAASVLIVAGISRLSRTEHAGENYGTVVDPAATASLQRTLVTLDNAIAEAQSELSRHPDDSYLLQVVQEAKADKSHALDAARAVTGRSR